MSGQIGLDSWLSPRWSGQLPRLLCLFTDEPLFQSQASDLFRQRLREQTEYQRQVMELDRGFDNQAFLGALSEGSLFGDVSLIELRLGQPKINKEIVPAIEQACQWIESQQIDHYLLVTGPKPNKTQASAGGLKQLLAAGVSIECPSISIESLPGWISRTCRNQGMELEQKGAQWLAECTEGNLLAAHQTIQKLAMEHQGQVSLETLQQVASASARFNVFDLGKTLLAGDPARITKVLAGLQAEGEADVLVLWSLLEEVRALSKIKDALQRGQNLQEACRNNRVWGDRQKYIASAVKRHSRESLQQLQQACYLAEKTIKGLRRGSAWSLFEMIGLGIAGIRLPALELNEA